MNLLLTSLLLIAAIPIYLLLRPQPDSVARASTEIPKHEPTPPVQTGSTVHNDSILASINTGVIAVDQRGTVLTINPAAERLFGFESQILLGHLLSDFIDTRLLQSLTRQILASGESASADMIVAGPEERTLEATGTVIRDSTGTASGVVLMLNDVTHIRQLETLRQDFVANVSHELKTPVASIQGFTETLLDGAMDDNSVRSHFLEIILHQSKRLRTIIDDLLKLARLESSNQNLELIKLTTSAAELLAAVKENSAEWALSKGISVVIECPDDFAVLINPSLFEQALLNLVDNAIKYGPVGSVITISAWRTNNGVTLSVKDTGMGISEEHLPRLFERFYRVDKGRSRAEGGSGLGLSIVKHIALAHGGQVSVESKIGTGSTFSISLGPESVMEQRRFEKQAVGFGHK